MANQNFKQIIENLKSNDENIVTESIELLRDEGTIEAVAPLVSLWINNNSTSIKQDVVSFLCDLKHQGSVQAIMQLLNDAEYAEAHKMLLSVCWLSCLKFDEYLEYFIDIVYTAPFDVAFEAFTVIENMQGQITVDRKNSLLNYVNNKQTAVESANEALTDDLTDIINNYELID